MLGKLLKMGFELLLAASTLLTPPASAPVTIQAQNLMEGVTARSVEHTASLTQEQQDALAQFSISLFQHSAAKEGNVLISPLSVVSALGMTANGAKGNTLAQMEQVIGLPLDTLNAYMGATLAPLTQEDSPLLLASSIWIKDDPKFSVVPDFLQRAADYYDADVYRAAFDGATLDDINNWVSLHTKNRIPTILDHIPQDALLYLVNALSFDGEWQEAYSAQQVKEGDFTCADGTKQNATMLHSTEQLYLDDGQATGFVKPYAGGNYAFAALLPREDVAIDDYIRSLTGEKLLETLNGAQSATVYAALPKFESKFGTELGESLLDMGMVDLFSGRLCDLTGLGSYPDETRCVSRVLHKTSIKVDEKGTQAGAATVVEIVKATSLVPALVKTVTLDRPFVYLIVDCTTNQPVFIGCLNQLEA